MSRAWATLVVLSRSLSPERLAQLIGVEGDEVRVKGSPTTPTSRHLHEFNVWKLQSQLPQDEDPAVHIDDVLRRVAHVIDRLETVAASPDVESVRVWLHLDSPSRGFSLERATLEAISRFATLEVSIFYDYILQDDPVRDIEQRGDDRVH